jgi:hypothetical protein
MDLNLRFRNGKIDGDGADGLDMFVIAGFYDDQKLECGWQKIYPTRQAVTYTGYREGKGIWGCWKLPTTQGGFHIWPLSEGGPPDLSKLEEEETRENVKSNPLTSIPVGPLISTPLSLLLCRKPLPSSVRTSPAFPQQKFR